MSKRAVIYARVSTDEQARGYSLPTQLSECRDYADQHNYDVVKEFSDDYTGASMDRPGLNQLREFVSQSTASIMVVYDLDRLARKSVYQMLIEEELSQQGVTVEYVNGQYADSDEGRLQKQIKASIAEYEKAKIQERSKRGKRGKAKSGYVIVGARPSYGYRKKSEPHKAWLIIDEEEARIVRMVFDWYVNGDGQNGPLSMRKIAVKLTDMKIPTRGDKKKHVFKKRGFGVWSAAMVRNILSNETYIGIWHYGKTKIVSDGKEATRKAGNKRGLGKQVARPRDEWIPVEVPAIIVRETWEAAQERKRLNAEQSKRNTRRKYLLGRRLKCAKCNYTYVGRTRNNRNQYYYCKGREQLPSLCDMPTFRADLAENAVWEWVKGLMEHPDQLAKGLRGERAEAERAHSALRQRLELVESQLAESEQQLERLLDLYLQGDFPKEVLIERKERLKKTVADWTCERDDIKAYLAKVIITDEQIEAIKAFCAEVGEGLQAATFEDKQRYFELLDVRGKLALENGEKVVYASCRLEKRRLSLVLTSPWSSSHNRTPRCITARLVIEKMEGVS